MIIFKNSKAWQKNGVSGNFSDKPDKDVWVVPDDSELALKIISSGLEWDPVLDESGNLIDISVYASRFVNAVVNDFRTFRYMQFAAFDIYKSNVDYGIIEETENDRQTIISWYNTMLAFPSTINENNYDTVVYPTTPYQIARYL